MPALGICGVSLSDVCVQVSNQLQQRAVAAEAFTAWCCSMVAHGNAATAMMIAKSSAVATCCDPVWCCLCVALTDTSQDEALDCAARVVGNGLLTWDDASPAVLEQQLYCNAALVVVASVPSGSRSTSTWRLMCDKVLQGTSTASRAVLQSIAISAEPSLASEYVKHLCMSLIKHQTTEGVHALASRWCNPVSRRTLQHHLCTHFIQSGQLTDAASVLTGSSDGDAFEGTLVLELCTALLRAGLPALAAAAVKAIHPEQQTSDLDHACASIGKTLLREGDLKGAHEVFSRVSHQPLADALFDRLVRKAMGKDVERAAAAARSVVGVRLRVSACGDVVRRLLSKGDVNGAVEMASVMPEGVHKRTDAVWTAVVMALVQAGDVAQASKLSVHITGSECSDALRNAIGKRVTGVGKRATIKRGVRGG